MSGSHAIEIIQVYQIQHQQAWLQLNLDYFNWLDGCFQDYFQQSLVQISGMQVDAYVATQSDKFLQQAATDGASYLLKSGAEFVAMASLRRLNFSQAELKRLYVSPAHRSQSYADTLLSFLKQEARRLTYQQLLLDTAPFMLAAHKLYHKHGFTVCQPYRGTEVPEHLHKQWHFMCCDL